MSNSTIYNGNSDGFGRLCDGYIEYGKEVIARRSFSDVRDGLKPVGRRCIYGASLLKDKGLVKCLTLVGEISKLHPHGDSSVYGALANMTDTNGTMLVPVFIGNGGLGKVYLSAKPAAMRYPKAKLGPYAQAYLRDMSASNMIPAEEGDGFEPEVLPVRFPAALVNGTTGMGVSVSTVVPSFNVMEVINITQEYLKTGNVKTMIAPDFPTGGILVRDDTEVAKIMYTGKGTLKVRAKVEIVGKEIHVLEVPYGKTVENIVKAIKKIDLREIKDVQDTVGRNSNVLLKITCKSLKSVDSVLMMLYKYRILQSSISSNMLFVEDKEPVMTGVIGVIERWVAWREKVATKLMQQNVDGIEDETNRLNYFIDLVDHSEWRDKFVDLMVHYTKGEAKDYLKELYPDIDEDTIKWISDISLSSFKDGGRQRKRYVSLLEERDYYEKCLADIDSYIYDDLEDFKKEVEGISARRTEETYFDYKFSKKSEILEEDDSYCVYTLYKDGFLTKTRSEESKDKEVLCVIPARANSQLIGFDCFGRILRVFGSEIPFTAYGDNGEYLPKYFGVDGYEGYRVLYMGLLDGKKRMLVYRDGFIGFLDTSEWLGKKKIKIVQKGVDVNVYNALVEVIEEEDFPEFLVVAEDSGKKVRFGVTKVSEIREASRKSRAKVFSGNNLDIRYLAGMSYIELMQFMEEPFYYTNRLRALGNREVYGDAGVIMKEGKYYEE